MWSTNQRLDACLRLFLKDKFASNTKGLDKKPKKGIQESNSHVSINVDDDSCSGSDI